MAEQPKRPEMPADPRAEVFALMMRHRFHVANPAHEDSTLLAMAHNRAEGDIRSLDPRGLAYARMDLREAAARSSTAEETYDPFAFARP